MYTLGVLRAWTYLEVCGDASREEKWKRVEIRNSAFARKQARSAKKDQRIFPRWSKGVAELSSVSCFRFPKSLSSPGTASTLFKKISFRPDNAGRRKNIGENIFERLFRGCYSFGLAGRPILLKINIDLWRERKYENTIRPCRIVITINRASTGGHCPLIDDILFRKGDYRYRFETSYSEYSWKHMWIAISYFFKQLITRSS